MALTPAELEALQIEQAERQRQRELEREIDQILRWFQYGHLPEGLLQQVSKKFAVLALELVERMHYTEQVKLGLYDLLRAKDCFVRAALAHQEIQKAEEQRSKQNSEQDRIALKNIQNEMDSSVRKENPNA